MPNHGNSGWYRRTCDNLVRGLGYCAFPLIILSVVTAGLSIYYTFTNLKMRTHRHDLIASSQALVERTEKIDKAFGSHDGMIVVVENTDKARSIKFANTLAGELQKETAYFHEIFYRVNPDRFKKWALLYLEPKQLQELKDQLIAHRQEMAALAAHPSLSGFFQVINTEITQSMIGHLFTSFLEEKEQTTIPDLSLLNGTLKELRLQLEGATAYSSPLKSLFPGEIGDLSQEGYFFTDNDKFLLFLVSTQPDGYTSHEQALKKLRQAVKRAKQGFPGLKVGVTGSEALEADEMHSAMKDIALATFLSILGQMLLYVIFLRSFGRTLAEAIALVIGLCWTLGLTTLMIGHLNLLSVIFAPLMLGLAIDYGAHWFARLQEEQGQRKHCSARDVSCTLRKASPGIAYAALTASVSFAPLVFTGFKGLAELGQILALGVLLMLGATLLLVPAFVILSERCRPDSLGKECRGSPRPFLSLQWRRPLVVVIIGAWVAAVGGVALKYVAFDLNPLHLQNPKTESVVWETKLLEGARYSTSYGAMTADSLQQLEEKSAALKKLPTVSHVESVLDFLPDDVAAKRQILQSLAPAVQEVNFRASALAPVDPKELADVLGRIRFKLAQAEASEWNPENKATLAQVREATGELSRITTLLTRENQAQSVPRLNALQEEFLKDLADKWELIRDNILNTTPLTINDLPEQVRERFVSPEGLFLIQAFPSHDIWDPTPLGQFVQSLRSVDPNVVGDPVLLYTFTFAFRNSILWAAAVALLAIIILLVILFRSLKLAALTLIPLWVGTGLTLIMMFILGVPFNQANVLFLPLILGEAVEFGIIILMRWRLEESARALTLPASTAKGVLLAALTTTVGFGSLMVSGHRGAFSLGLLATVGSLSVLLASLSVLPAVLRLLETRHPEPLPAFHPYLNLRRWLWHMVRKETQ